MRSNVCFRKLATGDKKEGPTEMAWVLLSCCPQQPWVYGVDAASSLRGERGMCMGPFKGDFGSLGEADHTGTLSSCIHLCMLSNDKCSASPRRHAAPECVLHLPKHLGADFPCGPSPASSNWQPPRQPSTASEEGMFPVENLF